MCIRDSSGLAGASKADEGGQDDEGTTKDRSHGPSIARGDPRRQQRAWAQVQPSEQLGAPRHNRDQGHDGEDCAPKHGVSVLPLEPVSYTHLRAHETVLDLVCRLLLEKKKQTLDKMSSRM